MNPVTVCEACRYLPIQLQQPRCDSTARQMVTERKMSTGQAEKKKGRHTQEAGKTGGGGGGGGVEYNTLL